MSKLRSKFMLALMLCKRLYKKPSFIIILVTLIAVTGVMSVMLNQDSSMVRVVIVDGYTSENADDIVDRLLQSDSVVDYSVTDEQTAYSLLEKGEVDAVWQFAEDFDGAVDAFASGNKKVRPVKVTVREANVFLVLTRERLYAEIFPYVGREIYREFVTDELDVPDDEKLMGYIDEMERNGGIVEYSYYNDEVEVADTNFLVTPLRGIIVTILVLCSMASAIYFLDDCDKGYMDAVPLAARYSRALMYTAAGTVNIALFVCAALVMCGLTVGAFAETATMLMLIIASVGFAMLIGGILGKTSRMAPVLPVLMIIMLVACPIFLNSEVPVLSWLFPPFWYLVSVYNTAMLPYMAIYCVAVNVLAFGVWKIRFRR